MKPKAEREGYAAYFNGKRLLDNPYIGSRLSYDWKRGWLAAEQVDNLKKQVSK